MSILGPFCRGNSGLPTSEAAGPPLGEANMSLYVFNGDVETINNGSVNHYSNGLPFSLLGRLVVSSGANISYYDQGIPYSALGTPVTGVGPVEYYDQGVAFNAAGEIVTI
jgi:hypothetical protein